MEVAEQMEKRMDEVKGMEEKQEARVNHYDTKLLTIIVAYLGWEAVFFFAIFRNTSSPNLSPLSCDGHWRVILALSCLCSLVYILLFLDAALMLYREENQFILILQKHARLCRLLFAIKQPADAIDSSMQAGDQSAHGLWLEEELMPINSNSPYTRRPRERKFCLYIIFCALVWVASLELYACMSVLCN